MYESFYKLSAKPFALTPDPRFFFESSGHKRVLSYLRYGIYQGEGFIVVTGEVGTGKTTLIQTLLGQLSNHKDFVIAHMVTPQLDPSELVLAVAEAFGVECQAATKPQALKKLETFLLHKAYEGKRALLIVDEAQNIPVATLEELRMLSNYNVGTRPLLQSCLLGQEEFRQTLGAKELEQLRQRVVASHHLGPMSPEETRSYIEYRLQRVGWAQDPEFVPETFEAIYEQTQGVPRRINRLCDRILLYGYIEELHCITPQVVGSVSAELKDELGEGSQRLQAFRPGSDAPTDARVEELERRVAAMEKLLDCHALMRAWLAGQIEWSGRS